MYCIGKYLVYRFDVEGVQDRLYGTKSCLVILFENKVGLSHVNSGWLVFHRKILHGKSTYVYVVQK